MNSHDGTICERNLRNFILFSKCVFVQSRKKAKLSEDNLIWRIKENIFREWIKNFHHHPPNPHAVATPFTKEKWLSTMTSWISNFKTHPWPNKRKFRFTKSRKILNWELYLEINTSIVGNDVSWGSFPRGGDAQVLKLPGEDSTNVIKLGLVSTGCPWRNLKWL